jgi:hypothetical protein
MQNREVRGDLDVEVALDLLYGSLFFRLLMGHAPLDEAFVDGVLDQALQGMHARRTARAPRCAENKCDECERRALALYCARG